MPSPRFILLPSSFILLSVLVPACAPTATIGRSVESRPIRAQTVGRGPTRVLILGGIHGNEESGSYVAAQFAQLLQAHPAYARDLTVTVIPEANPDGLARHTRGNAHKVDLNRNFPARNFAPTHTVVLNTGPAPLSEPESRALHDYIDRYRPHALISIHSIDRNRQCNNYDGPGKALAEAMAPHNHYPVLATIGYPTPGSLGNWAGNDRQIPMVTLELPRKQPAAGAWADNREALLAALDAARGFPRGSLVGGKPADAPGTEVLPAPGS